MHCPEVTVLMSVYNGDRYVRGAIDSILHQTFGDFELLIIDDGSTDQTASILSGYTDRRINVLTNSSNQGLTKSLNMGLRAARGNYIARIDADDAAHPERLAKQVLFLTDHSKTVLLGSNCYKIDESGTILGQTDLCVNNVQLKWNLLFYNCFYHSSVMFRRKEVTGLGGYNPDIDYAQDYDLWLRIAARYSVACLEEPLVYFRIPRKKTITFDKSSEQRQQAERLCIDALRQLTQDSGFRKETKVLRDFITRDGEIKNSECAEALFCEIYTAFCNSSFVADLNRDTLKQIKISPYMKFAWEYLRRGQVDDFDRCIREVMESGFAGPFSLPLQEITKNEKYLLEALRNFFFEKKQQGSVDAKEKDVVNSLYLNIGWQYYHLGDMKNFRRSLLCAFREQPTRSVGALLFTSLLGKWAMERIRR